VRAAETITAFVIKSAPVREKPAESGRFSNFQDVSERRRSPLRRTGASETPQVVAFPSISAEMRRKALISCYSSFSIRTNRVRRKNRRLLRAAWRAELGALNLAPATWRNGEGVGREALRQGGRATTGDDRMTDNDKKTGAKPSANGADDAVVIKKYANRRLYNTATSSYVTLDFLAEMVKNGEDFVVYDAKSNDDITHSVLTQIIFEEESKGQNLLPIQFLRQLIRFYGDSLQNFVPSYLEMSMNAFAQNQDDMRQKMRDAFGSTPGYAMFEEGVRKNMELYNQAMKMFSPMTGMYGAGKGKTEEDPAEIDELKSQLATLREKLEQLEKKGA
jgi:polyhydroxyalkanoate synthesis repressor PhaR